MRWFGQVVKQNRFWLLMLLFVLGMAAVFLWIEDAQAFLAIWGTVALFGVLLFFAACFASAKKEKKKKAAFAAFLEYPSEQKKEELRKAAGNLYADEVEALSDVLNAQAERCMQAENRMADYEEYVEAWAHEIKTPLSLLTMLLDNRREEFSPEVLHKLETVDARTLGFINQILYYARLRSGRKDYLLEPLSVKECIEETLADAEPLLQEKHVRVEMTVEAETVYSDRRGLLFLLSQIIQNAVKYSKEDPVIQICSYMDGDACRVLSIKDNGTGVKACDLPYIFEKGFTGDTGEKRKSATGMGLYLAEQMAKDLNLTLTAVSEWQQGFTMEIRFPVVTTNPPVGFGRCSE